MDFQKYINFSICLIIVCEYNIKYRKYNVFMLLQLLKLKSLLKGKS